MSETNNLITKGRNKGFRFWFATFALVLSVGVVAKFVTDGRSLAGEWSLMIFQLGVACLFAVPAGLLTTKLSKGCIVCRDDVCSNPNIKADE